MNLSETAHLRNPPPGELRELRGWLVWRFVQDPGEQKPRKVPFYVRGRARGKQGTPEDRAQLVTFEEADAARARGNFDGVGFCPLPEWGIAALDFDNCIADGKVHDEVERLVAGTYAEVSPSGRGVRAFVRGDLGNRKAHGEPFGIETFSSRGYVTFTGQPLEITRLLEAETTIASVSPEQQAYCAARFRRDINSEPAATSPVAPLGLNREQICQALAALDPDCGYDEWLRVGMALHHETAGEGLDAWDEWSSRGSKYPGRDLLEGKWDGFGRGGQRPTTAHFLINLANSRGAGLDLAQLQADDFDVVEAAPLPAKPLKFPLLSVSDLLAQKPPAWLVKGVVPQAELMVIFGESGSGKSFVVLDLFAAMARGVPWLGLPTRQGRVIYIAAEGRAGFGKRVAAYCKARDLEPGVLQGRFAVLPDTPNLLQRDDASEVVRTVVAAGGAAVVVVDTFAQVTPGANENAGEDMGKALANCKAIHRATGALVVLVHHTGKDQSRGARGWSGLKAAADAEIEISKTLAGRAIRVTKQKDGEDGRVWGFELDQVVLGADEDGDAITSCVVREVVAPVRHQIARLGKWQRAALDAVTELGGTGEGAPEAAVITAAIQIEAPEQGKRDRRAEYVRDALAELANRNVLEIADGRYRIV